MGARNDTISLEEICTFYKALLAQISFLVLARVSHINDRVRHGKFSILTDVGVQAHNVCILNSLNLPGLIVLTHGLSSTPVHSLSGKQRTLAHCWLGEQNGYSSTNIVKFTLPLIFELVSCTSYLHQSCHCLFISGCQAVPVCGDEVTKRLTCAAKPIAPKELVNCISFGTISTYTVVRQFRQSVFVSVAYMFYVHPFDLLHVKQPHVTFLNVLVITVVPSRGVQPYCVGLQKLCRNTLLHADANVRDSRNTFILPICKTSRRKTRQACIGNLTSS